MKEKQITTTQLRRTPGRLMDEARHTPLVITRFGRRSGVLLSYELYAALTAGRIVGRLDEAESRMVDTGNLDKGGFTGRLPLFAKSIRKRRMQSTNYSNSTWYLDEVFVKINGEFDPAPWSGPFISRDCSPFFPV